MQTINLPIALDESIAVPLYEQITQSLKDAITSGQLPHGSVIDSARELSRKLGVSRHTVMHSIEILQSQGYVESKHGRLTTVAIHGNRNRDFVSDAAIRSKDATLPNTQFGERVIALGADAVEINPVFLQPYQLPFNYWKRLVHRHMQNQEVLLNGSLTDPLGYLELRQELQNYLGRSRSVFCDPDQIVIFPDTNSALESIARLLIDTNSDIAVENPALQSSLAVFKARNLDMYPLDVDDEGACVQRLDALLNPPKMVYVTPAHNYPLGTTMSVNRRQELLSWVEKNDAFIIENDEDSLYRYTTRPMPSLQGLDPTRSKVIYMSSSVRALDPLVRLAFIVVPKNLCSLFAAAKQNLQQSIPLLDQLVLTDLLKSGFLERHVRRNAQTLAHRRRSFVIALTKAFRRNIRIAGESVGTFLHVQLITTCSNAAVLDAARRAGLDVDATAPFYLMNNPPYGHYVVSFASNIDETEIEFRVAEFARLVLEA